MEKTHRRGYAVDDEEFEGWLCCIAVPLDAQRQPVGNAVSISGAVVSASLAQKLPSIANHLLQCVRGISMTQGVYVDWAGQSRGLVCVEPVPAIAPRAQWIA